MKSTWAKFGVACAAVLVLVGAGLQIWIEWGVRSFSRTAMAKFPGDRESALVELVACETCSLEDRNHAVWALGQMRTARALPVLKQYKTHRRCDHAREICQYELDKAMARMMK
jgi:hypothetical protein